MEMEKGGMGKNKLVRAAEMVQKFYKWYNTHPPGPYDINSTIPTGAILIAKPVLSDAVVFIVVIYNSELLGKVDDHVDNLLLEQVNRHRDHC